ARRRGLQTVFDFLLHDELRLELKWRRGENMKLFRARTLALGAGLCVALAAGAVRVRGDSGSSTTIPGNGQSVVYFVGGDARDDYAHCVPWSFDQANKRGAKGFFFLG